MEKSDLDAKQIIDNLFDPEISEILAEMENGPKHCTFLSEKFGIVPEDLQEKLSEIMESGHNYKNVEDGLAKMDSFLN